MKKYLGWTLVSIPFLTIFASQVIAHGVLITLGSWAIAIAMCAVMFLGIHLIYPEKQHKGKVN